MSDKVERAKQAINEVFSDTNKPQSETRQDLNELMEEIQNCLDCLDDL